MLYTKKFGLVALLGTSILADQVFAMEDTVMTYAVALKQRDTADGGAQSSTTHAAGAGDATLISDPDKENSTARAFEDGVKSIASALAENKRGDGKRSDSPVKQKPEDKRPGSPAKQKPEEDKRSDIRKIVDSLLNLLTPPESTSVSTQPVTNAQPVTSKQLVVRTQHVVRTPQEISSDSREGAGLPLQLWNAFTAQCFDKQAAAGLLRRLELLEKRELAQLQVVTTSQRSKESARVDSLLEKLKKLAAKKVVQEESHESKGQDKAQTLGSIEGSDLEREIESTQGSAAVWKLLLEMELDLAKKTALESAEFFKKQLALVKDEYLTWSVRLKLEIESARKKALEISERNRRASDAFFASCDWEDFGHSGRGYGLDREILIGAAKEIQNAKNAAKDWHNADRADENAQVEALLREAQPNQISLYKARNITFKK